VVGGLPAGSGNCYVIDGRVVDADAPLYRPHVVTDDPEATFADHPDREPTDHGGV
jgi:hypothetical protein